MVLHSTLPCIVSADDTASWRFCGKPLYQRGVTATSPLLCAGVGLFTTVLNWLYVEPKNTELMSERYALENAKGQRDEAKIVQMRKEFGKWHGFSSVLNLAGLCGVMAHGWWLSGKLALIPA